MHILRGIFFVFSLILILSASQVKAFDTYVIHPKMAEVIAAEYNQTIDKKLLPEEIEWIKQGTIEEDQPITRAFNHFYNPLNKQGLKILGITLGLPSPEWSKATKQQQSAGLDCSWSTAVNAYKNNDKAKAFRCFGHSLHLLEDVGVPAHSRNDQHAFGDLFEEWAKFHNPGVPEDSSIITPQCTTAEACIIEFSTWINANFFSKNTIEDKDFPSPMNKMRLEGAYAWNGDFKLAQYNPKNKSFTLTQEIQNEYWQEISPVIKAYGQKLLEIFFKEVGDVRIVQLLEKLPQDTVDQEVLGDSVIASPVSTPVSSKSSNNKELIIQPTPSTPGDKKSLENKVLTPVTKPVQEENKVVNSKEIENIPALQTPTIPVFQPTPLITSTVARLPDTYITTRPASISNSRTADFVFSSDILGALFLCSDNGTQWRDCPAVYRLDNLQEGNHTIYVKAVTSVGTDSTPVQYSWTIDLTPPTTFLFSSVNIFTRKATFHFQSELGARFECILDDTAWAECQSPVQYDDISAGDHIFKVRGIDKVGNVEAVPSSHFWHITIDIPEPPHLIFPSEEIIYTQESNLTITAETQEGIRLLINDSDETCIQTDDHWSCQLDLVPDQNIFQITAVNEYQEQSEAIELTIIRDNEAPTALITDLHETYTTQDFSFHWSGFDNYTENLNYDLEYSLDHINWQTWQSRSTATETQFFLDQDWQELSFRIRAIDSAGNLGEWSEIMTTHYEASPSGHLVISQIVAQVGDDSTDEFIEIYNPTNHTIFLQGYQLQKKSKFGIVWLDVTSSTALDMFSIPAYSYFLIAGDHYSYTTPFDLKINQEIVYDQGGHLRIIDEDQEVDRLGYGGALNPEGLAAANPPANWSLQRKAYYSSTALSLQSSPYEGNGYDSNYNLFDFVLQNQVIPRASHNRATALGETEDGLLTLWHFDECQGETFDTINPENYGQLPEWTVGRYGCGLGQSWYASQQIDWPLAETVTASEVTMSVYVWEAAYSSSGVMWFLNSQANAGIGFKLSPHGLNPLFTNQEVPNFSEVPSVAEWHNITLTYGRNYFALYVDGILKKKLVGDYRLQQPLARIAIGQVNYPWKVDELALWNRVLSSEEIIDHTHRQLSPHLIRAPQVGAELVNFWDFDNEEENVDSVNQKIIPNPEIVTGRQGNGIHITWEYNLPETELQTINSKDLSLSFWRKKSERGNGGGPVFLANSLTGRYFGIGGGYGESYYYFNNSVEALGCYIPADDDWHHIALAYVNNKKIFLLNSIPTEVSYTDKIEAMDPICLNGDLDNITQ